MKTHFIRKYTFHTLSMATEFLFTTSLELIFLLCLFLTPAPAQGGNNADRHDKWRHIPQKAAPKPDEVSPNDYAARGAYFDQFSLTQVPLDQLQPHSSMVRGDGGYGVTGELSYSNASPVIVATVQGYTAHFSPSKISVYTDVRLKIENILRDGGQPVADGKTIHLLMEGASIKLRDGRIIDTVDCGLAGIYAIQPRHRYVFVLSYVSEGAFFLEDKSWEIINGRVLPNRADEAARFERGRSKYSGLAEKDFLQSFMQVIAERDDLARSSQRGIHPSK